MTIRLRNERFTFGARRKPVNIVKYERVDEKNVRIGTTWFYYVRRLLLIEGRQELANGVTIYGEGFKRFISNGWYEGINTDEL